MNLRRGWIALVALCAFPVLCQGSSAGMYYVQSNVYVWEDSQFKLLGSTQSAADHTVLRLGGTPTPIYLRDGISNVSGAEYGYGLFDPDGWGAEKWADWGYPAGTYEDKLTRDSVLVYEWGPQPGVMLPPSPDVFPTEVTYTTTKYPGSYLSCSFTKLVPVSGQWEPGIYHYGQYAVADDGGTVLRVGVTTSFMISPAVPEPLTVFGVLLGIGSIGGYIRRHRRAIRSDSGSC
jgi:hypothetical protein